MNTDYFPKQLYIQINGTLDYIFRTYKAASHNFTISTQFEHISSSNSTNDVAGEIFANNNEPPSYDLKAKHFIKHVLVGTLLLVPVLNFFIFINYESHEDTPVDTKTNDQVDLAVDLSNIQTVYFDKDIAQNIPLDTEGNQSKEEVDAENQPLPRSNSRVTLQETPHMHKLKRRNSRVSERALLFEQNKLNHQQEKLDAALPILNGERSNSVSIAQFKEIEDSFTKEFFRLFPNETCNSRFASLRKRQEEESIGVVFTDSKYIESLYLNTEGFTPEVRFKNATENLAALNQFILNQYPDLQDNFYILGNYKNDMQNKIDAIPYIHIIKILFRSSSEDFIKELNNYKFVQVEALQGEKIPIRIDTMEFQKKFKRPGSVGPLISSYKAAAASLK